LRIQTRQNARHERALRRQEERQWRRLPASRRAARRREIGQQRLLRAEQRRQQLRGAAAPAVQPLAAQATPRRGAMTAAQQAAARGRFGARFHARAGRGVDARAVRYAGRHAWRRGLHASFVAWTGPLFWPYVYSDIFDYTFFPYAYDDGFWAYAYDDFFDGVFWAGGGPYAGYADSGPYGGDVTGALPDRRASATARAQRKLAEQLCKQPGQGVTAWPFKLIEEAVRPGKDQQALLADLKSAAAKAADTFKSTCSTEAPLTPPGRLGAMLRRLQATLDAVTTVKPALVAFYNSLSDEQKARFNAIGPEIGKNGPAASSAASDAATCGEPKPGLTNLPIKRISDLVHPSAAQKEALDRLSEAAKEALGKLQAACPDEVPQTPVGRLETMELRLQAMVEAARIVQPALTAFYTSLSSEQKARFNTMGLDEKRAEN
jgi:hypothetical protein